MRRNTALTVVGSATVALAALGLCGAQGASATSWAWGSWTCHTVAFDNVCDQSGIYAGVGVTTTGETLVNSGSGPVAAGNLGAYTVLYKNGSQCRTAGPTYSDAMDADWYVQVTPGCGGGATYYDQGITSAWDGNQYEGHFTAPSPSVNN